MVRFGVPGQNVDPLSYADSRLATVPVVNAPRRPTVTDKKFPMWCEWRVNKDAVAPATQGEFWKLVRFESNGDATWVMFSSGGVGSVVQFETNDSGSDYVLPNGIGVVKLSGSTGISVTGSGSGTGNVITFALTGGGNAVDEILVDATDGGVNPVVPTDPGGRVEIFGTTQTAGSGFPVRTVTAAANQFHVRVQIGIANVNADPATPANSGLVQFNSNQFTVTGNGWTSLKSAFAFNWVEETNATRNLIVNQGVVGNRGTAQTFTLPTTAVLGDKICIVQKGAGNITIAQNASQTIHWLDIDTTTGVGGSMTTTLQWSSVCLLCITADTDWMVVDNEGNWDLI